MIHDVNDDSQFTGVNTVVYHDNTANLNETRLMHLYHLIGSNM